MNTTGMITVLLAVMFGVYLSEYVQERGLLAPRRTAITANSPVETKIVFVDPIKDYIAKNFPNARS